MITNAILQDAVIAGIVILSGLYTLKHFAPSLWRQGVRAIALNLESLTALPMLVNWGQRLHAANALGAVAASACASSGTCSSCGSCASASNEPIAAPIVMADPVLRRR